MDIPSLIAGASSSFTVLKDLGGLLVNERDRQKAAAIQVQFTEKLIDAQSQLLQVLSTVTAQQRDVTVLEKRVGELEAEAAEKQRYVLAKLGSEGEFFAYGLRPPAELEERVDEVPHFICQPCFEVGKKLILNSDGDGYMWCPGCNHGAQVSPEEWRPPATKGSRSGFF